jgi:DNA repair protein RecO (recombination protein O)
VSSILIRHRDVGEADRIVTLFTEQRGKLSAIAKGVKRLRSKFAGGLQLFSHSQVLLAHGRSLPVVTQVQPVAMCYHLRDDMDRYAHASYAAEMVDVLTEEGDRDPAVFELLLATLHALDAGGDMPTLVRGFELRLLTQLGYGPELVGCVSCGAEVTGSAAGFAAGQGGVVCKHCLHLTGAGPLTPTALRAMREMVRMATQELAARRLSRRTADELARVMRAFVDHQLGRPLRSAAFLPR